ncbi:MAG: hypothetical protein ACRET4_09960 [Steroidobacteraceae bacterium]
MPAPLPTAPTLYYACMAAVGNVEYDSVAFAAKNPGPDYASHSKHNQKMTAAFQEYLKQKYGYNGYTTCGQFNTLAEAKKWLAWRKSESEQPGKNYTYQTTDWAYAGASAEPATTATSDATAPAAQTVATSTPTAFWYCIAIQNRVEYDSAVFAAPNNTMMERRALFTFRQYVSDKYKVAGNSTCLSKPTRAAAEAALQSYPAGVYGGISQRIATGWVSKHE